MMVHPRMSSKNNKEKRKSTDSPDTGLPGMDRKDAEGSPKEEHDSVEAEEIKKLREELTSSLNNADELKKTLQFVQAEFENYKKRQERYYQDKLKTVSADIILKILPIIDDFEHSLKNLRSSCLTGSYVSGDSEKTATSERPEDEIPEDDRLEDNKDLGILRGFQMIYKNLLVVLKKEGLEEIYPLGDQFDPYLHEAVMQEKSDNESGTVLEVLQKGYKLNGRVIRYARVKVAQ